MSNEKIKKDEAAAAEAKAPPAPENKEVEKPNAGERFNFDDIYNIELDDTWPIVRDLDKSLLRIQPHRGASMQILRAG